jgi:glutathione peroxidase
MLKHLTTSLNILAGALTPSQPVTGTAYDFELTAINGSPLPLSQFKGKVLLVVNTASRCGFTPQYKGLQALWQEFKDRGLVILGVPSNDFAGQEPGSDTEIQGFCELNFGVDFPLTRKVAVLGSDAHPFFKWLSAQKGVPKWNFHKYLIGPDGTLVDDFAAVTTPDAKKLRSAIEALLPA